MSENIDDHTIWYDDHDLDTLINKDPLSVRLGAPRYFLRRPQVQVKFFLPIALYAWIEEQVLPPLAWGWREFCEAAVLAVLNPEWPHITWWGEYDKRGAGNKPLDNPAMGKTPFLDQIPDKVRFDPKTVDPRGRYAYERREVTITGGDPRRSGLSGCVFYAWHGDTHAFLRDLCAISPRIAYSDRSHRKYSTRVHPANRPLTVPNLVQMCIDAHFTSTGTPAGFEAMFQMWREFAAVRAGLSDRVYKHPEILRQMARRGLCCGMEDCVRLGAAITEPLPRTAMFRCGFYPQRLIARLKPHDEDEYTIVEPA